MKTVCTELGLKVKCFLPYRVQDQDRFFTAIKTIVLRVLNEAPTLDYRALYPAKIVRWQSSGVVPSGVVDVVFDDVNLQSKAGVPLLPPIPGATYQPTNGTRCLIGWKNADERYPYAIGWDSSGSVTNAQQTADTYIASVAPTVHLGAYPAASYVCISQLVTALTTLATAIGTFATAVGVAVPAVAGAATTLNTAITTFNGASSTYTATKVKAT